MALILPALSGAKRRAKRVVCMNNLRQFASADLMYLYDYGELPAPNPMVPSSTRVERLAIMAQYLGVPIPPGAAKDWPRRENQPRWINCPMAVDSRVAEGITMGGGLYTGYVYVGAIENSAMVTNGFITVVNPGQSADRMASKRGVLWADILDEFIMNDPRRYEFFHLRSRVQYPDFRFNAGELDGIHRAWSDGSVEWVRGSQLDLSGPKSPDLRLRHTLGNYYY